MSEKLRVLFLCTNNAARSQMAEGLVNGFLGDRWSTFSAGTEPASSVHPLAVRVMNELGIDISDTRPKPVDEFRNHAFDAVFTLCGGAAQGCPLWLGRGQEIHVGLPDPAQVSGNEHERLDAFRQVRDAIRDRVFSRLEAIESIPTREVLQ
jgi:arsenate reductase